MGRGPRSDSSGNSNGTGSSVESRSKSPNKNLTPTPFIEKPDSNRNPVQIVYSSPRPAPREPSPLLASSRKPSHDTLNANASSSRLPHDVAPGSRPKGNHRADRGKRRHPSARKPLRPLPPRPSPSPRADGVTIVSTTRPAPRASQPHRSTSVLKGRRRSVQNSIRAGYNWLFAHPGSSTSGSAYAPTTVLTSEISERPATSLSPVTEVSIGVLLK